MCAKLGDLPSNFSFPWIAKRIRYALLGYLSAGNFCFGLGGFGAIDLGLVEDAQAHEAQAQQGVQAQQGAQAQ